MKNCLICKLTTRIVAYWERYRFNSRYWNRNGRVFPLINFDTLRASRFPANDLNGLPANTRGRLPL